MPHYRFPKPYADAVARLRVPSGFLLLTAFAWLSQPTGESLLGGIPISLCGLVLRAWAAGHLAKNQRLVDSGPYRHTRNPLYLGTLITAMGLAVAARSWWVGGIFAAVFVFVYLPVMELEEQHLRNLFPDYNRYADSVPLLVPRFPGIASEGRFSKTLYLRNQEYQALIGFLLGVGYLWWRSGRALGA
ncbi:MAG: isoprenylcysteine carboxylmethyltransferase family protein [Acidobacteria bacterium]|nr:isoprenylcysteine carboxylmethyltransferase family protein [Acidobacteriota bacterium]